MILNIDVHLHYAVQAETDIILQITVPDFADQRLLSEDMDLSECLHSGAVLGEERFGERKLLHIDKDLECRYRARVEIDRPLLDIASLPAVAPHKLPNDALRYLMPSRYCQADQLQSFVEAEFGDSSGGERIARIRDWIFESFRYSSESSNSQTTAIDTFVQRQGVCRDFAHVLIALARASSIPARFVSGYAPYVIPQDFHAVAEVYLDHTWHLVDATGMAASNQIARIGIGLDAAEVSFLSSFGFIMFQNQSVQVNIED
ncbi:transglutaminase-like domain-containing protein [Congregibacter litoralis]|uniref:Transglutaminase-like enzyme, putative cysteine protease n=1 Tax=Congregibacter litoralis KT71 TaxID=314285 RepID=A4ADC0_9GAMM|nr:transglutaminase family protein [Congregibacter litoralis]EAQ96044.1 Transglutaminase-like enzyme, putative cysteine protease [Congregibacter litoralis KT71]